MSATLEEALEAIADGEHSPLYLLIGEELLVRKGADEIIKRLVPNAAMGLSLVPLDGASPREISQELATMPLFPGPKVVLTCDPEFVAPKKGRGDALGRAREAWKANRRKEAARRLLAIAARAGWTVADIDPSKGSVTAERWQEELNIELGDADLTFIREVAEFAKEENITAPESDEAVLIELFEKGLPKSHSLVIAATEFDAKCALARIAKKHGVVIERKVAAKLKDVDVTEIVSTTLAPYKKKMASAAIAALKDRCGGNMRLLQSELEKLAQYVQGATIQIADVEQLVGRSREEEFLELSEALQKRDLPGALAYVDDALSQSTALLALLGSIASIVRTLLMNHERLTNLSGGSAPRSFDDFKARVFPKIEAEIKGTKARLPHPYAAFMQMQAAARFTREELLAALAACAESDLALKLGGGRLVIERLLWTVCGKIAPWDSGMATIRKEWER